MNKKLIVFASLLVVLSSVGGVAAHEGEDHKYSEQVTVEVQADGDVRLSIIEVYDLNSSEEKKAFNDLKANGGTKQEVVTQFRNRMSQIAEAVSNETGRDVNLRSSEVNIRASEDSHQGTVVYSAVFSNLAAVDGNKVTLSEPFNSGFSTDKRFVVVGPDGYNATSVTPDPDQSDNQFMVWDSPSFDSFEVVFTGPENAEQTTTADGGRVPGSPGFGVGVGLLALVASTALAYRRR